MSMLLVRPKPYPDECIVSYLIRVSESNGFKHLGHLLQYAGLPWKNLRAPTHQMITGEYDIEPYFVALGLVYKRPRTADVFEATQSPAFTTKIFVKHPKVCLQCLEEEGYGRQLWSYITYSACHRHKIMLTDIDPTSGAKLSWYRSTTAEPVGGSPFHPPRIKASTHALTLSKSIAYLTQEKALPDSSPSILKGLNFGEVLSLIHFIAHYQYRLSNGDQFSPSGMDNLTVSHHYTNAWKDLRQWPQNFHLLLSHYIDNPMSQRGQTGINKHFRDLHEKLHRQRDNKGISRLRAAFDQYIDVNWPNALQTQRLTRISLSPEERPLIKQKEAQRILSCREPRIRSLIAQRKITLHHFKGQSYFNRDEVNALARLYQENWSMEQAVEAIELSRYQLKQLLDAGLIKALQKADTHNRDWLICKKSWIRQLDSFRKRASMSADRPGKSLSGIQKQGLAITDIFILMEKRKIEYKFAVSTDTPFSFKQLRRFSTSS